MKEMKLVLLLLLILPFGNNIKAQEAKSGLEKKMENRVNRLSQKLELSKDQIDRLYELNLNLAHDRNTEKERLKKERKAKVEAYKLKVKAILSKEQYEKFLELRETQKIKRKEKRKRKRIRLED